MLLIKVAVNYETSALISGPEFAPISGVRGREIKPASANHKSLGWLRESVPAPGSIYKVMCLPRPHSNRTPFPNLTLYVISNRTRFSRSDSWHFRRSTYQDLQCIFCSTRSRWLSPDGTQSLAFTLIYSFLLAKRETCVHPRRPCCAVSRHIVPYFVSEASMLHNAMIHYSSFAIPSKMHCFIATRRKFMSCSLQEN